MSQGGWWRRTLGGAWMLRRVYAELRRQRIASERIADALELLVMHERARAGGSATAGHGGGQTFSTFGRRDQHLTDQEVGQLTSVAYTSERDFNQALEIEDRLRSVLKRQPTEDEVERAWRMEQGERVD